MISHDSSISLHHVQRCSDILSKINLKRSAIHSRHFRISRTGLLAYSRMAQGKWNSLYSQSTNPIERYLVLLFLEFCHLQKHRWHRLYNPPIHENSSLSLSARCRVLVSFPSLPSWHMFPFPSFSECACPLLLVPFLPFLLPCNSILLRCLVNNMLWDERLTSKIISPTFNKQHLGVELSL